MFIPLGLISELEPQATAHLPALAELQQRLPPAQATQLAAYLKAGDIVCDVMEMCVDPLDRSVRIPGGSGLQSDGQWVWRQDLHYYVERYQIWLDPAFVSHALGGAVSTFRLEDCEEATATFSKATRLTSDLVGI